jgi:hypothetical protein
MAAVARGGMVFFGPMGDSSTVERAALTRLILVRIQVPQPKKIFYKSKTQHTDFVGFFISQNPPDADKHPTVTPSVTTRWRV